MVFFSKKENNLSEEDRLLIENELRFKDIFEQSATGESILNLEGKWLDVNSRLCEITGYSKNELLSKNFNDITHPEDKQKSLEAVKKLLSGETQKYNFEKRYIHKTGKIIWVLLSISVFRNGDNKPHYFIAHTQDITKLKETEAELLKAEEDFKNIFNNTNDSVYIHNLRGEILEVNETACKKLNYTKKELLSLSPQKVDSLEFKKEIPGRIEKVLKNGFNLFETVHVTKDNKKIPMEVNAKLIDFHGEKAIISICRDITERKKVEEKIKSLVYNIPGMVYTARPDWSAEIISGSTEICGYEPEDFINKKINWVDLIHLDDKKIVFEQGSELQKEAKKIIQKYRIITKNKSIKWVEDHKISCFDKEGHFNIIYGVVYDITKDKELESKLKESEERFNKVFDQAPILIAISHLESGEFLEVNKTFLKTLGYRKNEIIGHTSKELNIFVDYKKRNAVLQEFKNKGFVRDIDIKIRNKKGEIIIGSFNLDRLEVMGKKYLLTTMVGVAERIRAQEELKASESLLHSIVRSTDEGLLVINREGKVVFYNDKFKEFWIIPEDLLKVKDDKKLLEFVVNQLANPKEFLDKVDYLYAHPEEVGNDIVCFKNGRVFERYSIPQKIGQDIVGRIWSFRDVTEKNKTLKEEREHIIQIERINKLAINRELRMAELKKEIKELKSKLEMTNEN